MVSTRAACRGTEVAESQQGAENPYAKGVEEMGNGKGRAATGYTVVITGAFFHCPCRVSAPIMISFMLLSDFTMPKPCLHSFHAGFNAPATQS